MPISQDRMLTLIEIADFFKEREEQVFLALQTFSTDPQGLSSFLSSLLSSRPPSLFYETLGAEKKHFSSVMKKNERTRELQKIRRELKKVEEITVDESAAWERWLASPDFDPSELPPELRRA